MKTCLAIIFFFMAALCCHADPAAGKSGSVTITYTGPEGKLLEVTSENLSNIQVKLPLFVTDLRHWTADVERVFDRDKNDPGKSVSTNQCRVRISDVLTLTPPHGDYGALPTDIFDGTFEFENGKPVTVLKTTFYSITVTVTFPDDKK